LAGSNLQFLAAQYYPQAFEEIKNQRTVLEKQRRILVKQRKSLVRQTEQENERLVLQQQRVERISKRLLVRDKNQNRRAWAYRIWFVKDLSTHVLFLVPVVLMVLFAGIAIGVNQPDGVVCQKGSLCDRLRVHDRKLTF